MYNVYTKLYIYIKYYVICMYNFSFLVYWYYSSIYNVHTNMYYVYVFHARCFVCTKFVLENHRPILLSAGFKNIRTYRYLNMETMTLDFEGLCKDLSNAPSNSVIILHACGHNPTSVDPTKKQWKIIANIIKVSY